jgi:hypothetical protein
LGERIEFIKPIEPRVNGIRSGKAAGVTAPARRLVAICQQHDDSNEAKSRLGGLDRTRLTCRAHWLRSRIGWKIKAADLNFQFPGAAPKGTIDMPDQLCRRCFFSTAIALLLYALPLLAAEPARVYPLWDGHESVESYAKKVNLSATKSIDLGGGVSLDLVLIPAGEFIMGSVEPAKPTVTVRESVWMSALGGLAMAVIVVLLVIKCVKQRKFSFSLSRLLLITVAASVWIGGFARALLAQKEVARYESEMTEFNKLPANEKPAHWVTLIQPFYMGTFTVTQAQYQTVMGHNPSSFKGAQLPVEMVSWEDVTEFCKRVSGQLNDKLSEVCLPTEAQWEYACRAGTRTRFYSGDLDSDLDAVGWSNSNCGGTTHPVGLKRANAFGLHDMHGNVFQWCQDFFDEHYYSIDPPRDPKGAPNGETSVSRGGSWYTDSQSCRSSFRYSSSPVNCYFFIGFRVVLALRTP